MKNIITVLAFTIIAMTSFYCCTKSGCTDKDSVNYDPEAIEDDGSCQYEGQVIFWYDNTTKMKLLNAGIINIDYFVDGYKVGSAPVTAYSATEPVCGQSGLVTATQDMGETKTLSLKYEIYDAANSVMLFNGQIAFKANDCVKIRLVK